MYKKSMNKKTFLAVLITTLILGGTLTTLNYRTVANADWNDDSSNTGIMTVNDVKYSATEVLSDVGMETKTVVISLTDISKHWAKAAIDKAVEFGYAKGYPDGTFKPNSNVTRAEFIKMTVEALKLPIEIGTGGTWYDTYVNAAKKAELYVASDFKSGDLNSPMTRKEMSRLAARAVGEKTTDDAKWMYLATKKGLVSGLGSGELGESKNTTRAQSVTIIDRILTVNSGGKLPVDKYAVASAEVVWHGTNIFTVMPEVFVDNKAKEDVAELWKKDKLIFNSKDGNWHGEIEYVIAIDLEDPNDPNLKLIPPISQLKWQNNLGSNLTEGIPVSQWTDSYLIYYKSKVVNKDSKHYSQNFNYVPLAFSGTNTDLQAFVKGKLNMVGSVFKDKPLDQPIYIFPKKGWSQIGNLTLYAYTPSFSSYYYISNQLLSISGPFFK
jgi:hypothetical protein